MSETRFFLFFFKTFLFLALVFQICHGLPLVDLDFLMQSEASSDILMAKKRVCTGSIGECLSLRETGTAMMDSESNRRILAMQKKYISYGTLRRDMVPCDQPGASYYNCHARQANPYRRGCEIITTCARGEPLRHGT